MSGVQRESLERVIGRIRAPSTGVKTALLFAALAIIVVIVASYDRRPNLSYVDVSILSGSERGNYYAIVARLAAEAKRQHGRITNVTSAGSIENIARLAAGRTRCDVQFALVQDGLQWPKDASFDLVGRLGKPESLVVLGRGADSIKALADVRGMRVGIGPAGSGTEAVARQVLKPLAELNLQVSTHPLDEQLAALERGDLDLGMMVIDEDAELLVDAIRRRGLQLLDIAGAEGLANRLPFARAGHIEAGHYDPIHQLPATDKRIIQIDTLVVGNGCARESATQGLITALVAVFPDFIRVNRERQNLTGLPLASASASYFESGGPDAVGAHVPWFIDIMPTARWLQLIFGFSLLFNAMAVGHRFRLWRLDARRVKLESEVPALLAPGMTVSEIAAASPQERQRSPETRKRLDRMIDELSELAERCRRQSLSVLVPMGQEMSYRYQESLIAELLHALRRFRAKLDQ
jgi:TRAP-type uncharacterized transport system substrate-binding protein